MSVSLIIAIAALLLAATYVHLLARRVDLGLISLLAAELINFAVGPDSALFGVIHISPLDAVSVCLFAAGAIRTIRAVRSINLTRFLAVGYVVIFVLSLARGFSANGIFAAGNESRGFVGPLVAALYFLTAPVDQQAVRRYTLCYLYFGAALCAMVILAAAGLPIGIEAWAGADLTAIDGRYLPSDGAAAIAVCGFLSLALAQYRNSGMLSRSAPVIFMAFAIYLRHRTVWAMMAVGVVALLLLDVRLFRRILPAALAASIVVGAVAVYGSAINGGASEGQFSESATNSQTFIWRINGWRGLLLDDDQDALTVTLGKSMGSGYWRIDPVSYRAVAVAPHSEYIQEYLRVGVVGAFFIVIFSVKPLGRLWRMNRENRAAVYPSASGWAIVVLITLVYGITYGIEPHSYALIGLANAIAMAPKQQTAEEEYQEAWQMEFIAGQPESAGWA